MKTFIDPPGGWRYGFPKEYRNPTKLPLQLWLINEGYPRRDAEFASHHCRFWEEETET